MGTQKRLDSLPLEVIHQIFHYVSPSDLASLRRTCKPVSLYASSNYIWQFHCQSLWKSKVCLEDCTKVPSSQWSFSLVPDGWFRAYTKTREIAFSQWLMGDETLDNTLWMVFFKASLVNVNSWPIAWQALVEINESKIVSSIDGLPLNPSRWYVDKQPSFRVTAYPPNVPGRDRATWCRLMQHIQVLMISDAPEFLLGLADLDRAIRDEISKQQKIESIGAESFEKTLSQLVSKRKVGIRDRLKELLIARADTCAEEGSISPSSLHAGAKIDIGHPRDRIV